MADRGAIVTEAECSFFDILSSQIPVLEMNIFYEFHKEGDRTYLVPQEHSGHLPRILTFIDQESVAIAELDRICTSTITHHSETGLKFLRLVERLQRSNDAQVQQLAKALHNKFDEVGLMTSTEYRRIRSNIYDRDRRANPCTVSY